MYPETADATARRLYTRVAHTTAVMAVWKVVATALIYFGLAGSVPRLARLAFALFALLALLEFAHTMRTIGARLLARRDARDHASHAAYLQNPWITRLILARLVGLLITGVFVALLSRRLWP